MEVPNRVGLGWGLAGRKRAGGKSGGGEGGSGKEE